MSAGGFENLTDGEVGRQAECQAELEEHWQERLEEEQEEQRAAAGRLLGAGLTGRLQIGDGFRFTWLRGDEPAAQSDFRPRFPEAFGEAVRRLPAGDRA